MVEGQWCLVSTSITGLPTGFRARRPVRGDLEALLDVCCADEKAAIGECTTTATEVEHWLQPPHATLQDDQWVVTDASGLLVAWGLVWDAGDTPSQQIDLYRDPARAPEAVQGALVDALLLRLAERARQSGFEAIEVGTGCYAADHGYARTLRGRGFTHVRTFHRMRIDLEPDADVVERVTPDGVWICGVDPADEAALREVHAVIEQGFVDHWGAPPVTYEAFREELDSDPQPDVAAWRRAYLDGRLVGVCKASGRSLDDGGGHVSDLCVLPEARGRGLAKALLHSTFEAYRQAGRRWVELDVDSQNADGAVRLYESVGMRVHRQIHMYQRVVQAAPARPSSAA
jgi:ribosomal protein S18 acetylase RimI-like enzyme